MSNTVIVGAQWGDEGKGKIVDYLTESADVVVRAQGGNNAGHTVISDGEEYILHLIPSGILYPEKVCVIANITLTNHSEEATATFQRLVDERPEIMECHAISGAYDYMLKVRVRDVEAYETFLSRWLLPNPFVASVSSGFTLRELKHSTALPL